MSACYAAAYVEDVGLWDEESAEVLAERTLAAPALFREPEGARRYLLHVARWWWACACDVGQLSHLTPGNPEYRVGDEAGVTYDASGVPVFPGLTWTSSSDVPTRQMCEITGYGSERVNEALWQGCVHEVQVL